MWYVYLYICTFIYIYIWVGVELGTQRHSKWSENQICSLSPPPTSIATHLPPVCRLHSSHPHLPPYRSPLWPRYRSTLAATLPPRASKARTSTALWSCRQPPSSTLRRRPNSIPHGPQALELKPPFFPFSPPHSVYLSLFWKKERFISFLNEFSRALPLLAFEQLVNFGETIFWHRDIKVISPSYFEDASFSCSLEFNFYSHFQSS